MKTTVSHRLRRANQARNRPEATLGIRAFVAVSVPLTVLDDSDSGVIEAVRDSLGISPEHEVLDIVVTEVGGEPIRKEIPHEAVRRAFRPDRC